MKVILFDLGKTLENNDVLLPGARETLEALQGLSDAQGVGVVLALISDFGLTNDPLEIPPAQQEFYHILDQLGIRSFFEPVAQRVTLSIEVGAQKPERKIFEAAIKKIGDKLGFQDAVFITENGQHVEAARQMGIKAIHFKGPGETAGDVDQLTDLIPLIQKFLNAK
jgi:FMN phosphatase YigB (HAD superfamily)